MRSARRHIDDCSTCAPVPGRHTHQCLLRTLRQACHVDCEHVRQFRYRKRFKAAARTRNTCIVDERFKCPQLSVNGFEQTADIGRLANIGLHRDGMGSALFDICDNCGRRRFGDLVVHTDNIALFTQHAGRCGANPPASSGNDGNFIIFGHVTSPL